MYPVTAKLSTCYGGLRSVQNFASNHKYTSLSCYRVLPAYKSWISHGSYAFGLLNLKLTLISKTVIQYMVPEQLESKTE